ncbi:SGNH/GDSL hydrolase family protein [Pseudomonas psychrophila]|uniref:SGNH/GDSL hydrolase family protein n=1 Tax=Pseudomonas psychrophila TaxID=122355 RepID=UPI0002E4808E|nr:SGNH/GDSL hydrolase family protein [Pseudomonas psychrophila]
MELKNFFAQDDQGNKLPGAVCYLYQRGTESPVPGMLKSNGIALVNPFFADQNGLVQLAAPNGLYDVRVVSGARDYRLHLQFNDVAETVEAAEAAAVRAETAQDAAVISGGVKDDIAHGLATTSPGENFQVLSPEPNKYVAIYKNKGGGVAEPLDSYPNSKAIEEIGIEEMDSDLTGYALSTVDDNDHRLWIEAGLDGGPTPYAARKIGATLTQENSPVLAEGITGKAIAESLEAVGIEALSELNDQSFAIADENDRRLWLEAGSDGKPSAYAMKCIIEKLPGDIGGAPSTYNAGTQGVLKMVSGPNFTAPGDSMTQGAGGNGTTYTGVLQSLLTAAGHPGTVTNRGVGGETSVTITARMGGYPFMVLPVAEVIPATTTPFEITLLPINGQMPAPLKQGYLTYTGRLGAVPGTFSRTESSGVLTYYFTRATAGPEVVANRPMPMYLDVGIEARGDIYLIWIGQNGPDTTRAIQDAKALIQQMTALDKRYLVISKPGGTSAQDAEDAQWFAEFGRRFIPIRQYMVKYGLADAGITPTAQDIIDMANGTVPSSLRVDPTHWGAAGYTILGHVVFQRLIELEWV